MRQCFLHFHAIMHALTKHPLNSAIPTIHIKPNAHEFHC